jgi:soluble lytic murein transglycosylase-like protein
MPIFWGVRLLCATVGLLVCADVWAQDQDAIRAAMSSSIEKQKESVRRQAGTITPIVAPAAPASAAPAPAAAGSTTAPAPAASASPTAPAAPTPSSFFTVAWPTPANFAAVLTAAPPDCDPLPAKDVDALVDHAAKQEKVEARLIHAVMEQESAFKPCAISDKGAQGLMQLMPTTASNLNVTDAFDPSQNVGAGAKLLRLLLDKYKGDTRLALSAYNAGDGRVDQAGSVPDIQETQDYVASIMNRLAKDASATVSISDPAPAVKPGSAPTNVAKPAAAPAGAVKPASPANPPAPASGP